MKRIKKDDTVIVITGKRKTHVGKVLRVEGDRVVVEGANIIKKHVKPNPQLNQKGGIVSRESSLHVSNVAHYNASSKKADRVGFKYLEKDGAKQKVRFYKSDNELVDLA